eukprot:421234-Pelagomonas_calceolata.AAC.4
MQCYATIYVHAPLCQGCKQPPAVALNQVPRVAALFSSQILCASVRPPGCCNQQSASTRSSWAGKL